MPKYCDGAMVERPETGAAMRDNPATCEFLRPLVLS